MRIKERSLLLLLLFQCIIKTLGDEWEWFVLAL